MGNRSYLPLNRLTWAILLALYGADAMIEAGHAHYAEDNHG